MSSTEIVGHKNTEFNKLPPLQNYSTTGQNLYTSNTKSTLAIY